MKNDGGPAFPKAPRSWTDDLQNGMSLRDWLAGMAMNGMFADPSYQDTDLEKPITIFPDDIVTDAYRVADAMIAEGKKC